MDDREAIRPRRLVRRTDDRAIGGVCSGLADYFDTDPVLFRIAFVVAGMFGWWWVYLVAWAVIPEERAAPRRRLSPFVLFGLVVAGILGLVYLTDVPAPLVRDGYAPLPVEPLAVAAGLVGIGLVLLRERAERSQAPAEMAPIAAPPRVRLPRERSGLTAITLALMLLVLGGAALGASSGWAPLDVGQLAALALLVVGLGLLVGAWAGRARLLVAVGTLMVPVVLAASLVDFPPSGTIGSPYLSLTRPGELENMRVLAGQVTLDLSRYPFAEGTEEARLRVAAGSMTVIVPHDVRVTARVSVEAGEAFVFGDRESGLELGLAGAAGPERATKKLELDVTAGFGSVGIYRTRDGGRARDRRPPGEGPKRDRARETGSKRKGARR
ncbi:MAG TPA: PspC domain-containing protein [Actinomycetota bacterium]|nr:PspC domain-containing protein [Actinomycetota bacterium]